MLFIFTNSCSEYEDNELWERLNSLKNRVAYIEDQLEVFNSDINSVSSLANALLLGLYVTDINSNDNGYTFTFSDQSVVVVNHGVSGKDGEDGVDGRDGVDGKDGQAGKDAPVINVRYYNGSYYWVQTINGATEWLIDDDGDIIPASGEDGVTPQLKVDSDDNWIVSYDNGYNFYTLVDLNGNAVKASGKDAISYFDSIEISKDEIRLVLIDGAEIIIPIGEIPPLKAIDLGLSVKWASFNLGANSPTGSGELYYWGDPDNSGGNDFMAPLIDNICGTQYDIARAKWGSTWRLPSQQEQTELIFYCNWSRVTVNGVQGMRITGTNGNSIFLPPTGFRILYHQRNEVENGYYWVGETYSGSDSYAYVYYFNSTSYYYDGGYSKNSAKLAIRPVKE